MAFSWQSFFDIGYGVVMAAAAAFVAWRSLRKSAEPLALIFKWGITALLIFGTIAVLRHFPPLVWPVIVLIPAMTVGLMWTPSIAAMMASAMSGGIDGGGRELEPQPCYSMAQTKRCNGHPQEAILLLREQLEKFPGDFPGVMLLAAIQAEDLRDLTGAQATLENWIQGPAATPQGLASALTALADWHLQFARDPEAARVALERIVRTLPDTPLAHQAAQRLAHLPTVEHLLASRPGATVDLPSREKDIGLRKTSPVSVAASNPEVVAEGYVKQLEKHPADTDTREKLAVLYAEHFHRLDLAVDQLEQLIAFPKESPKHVAHWLNLLADLHIRVGRDMAAAEAALRRIMEQFPNTALAAPAMARLAALNREMKAGRATQVKTLGHYEKDLGLKKVKG